MLRATIAAAQIPAEGLKAEGEHRWGDALALYEPVVRDHPERADLWVRISDIRAAMGDVPGSLAALYAAVNAAGSDGDLYARLSRAYAAANQPKAALAAIQGAVALRPSDPGLLKAQGDLAAWAGNISLAPGVVPFGHLALPDRSSSLAGTRARRSLVGPHRRGRRRLQRICVAETRRSRRVARVGARGVMAWQRRRCRSPVGSRGEPVRRHASVPAGASARPESRRTSETGSRAPRTTARGLARRLRAEPLTGAHARAVGTAACRVPGLVCRSTPGSGAS